MKFIAIQDRGNLKSPEEARMKSKDPESREQDTAKLKRRDV